VCTKDPEGYADGSVASGRAIGCWRGKPWPSSLVVSQAKEIHYSPVQLQIDVVIMVSATFFLNRPR